MKEIVENLKALKADSLTAWVRDYGSDAGFDEWWSLEAKRHAYGWLVA